jgi:phosphoribosylanthranilate isomerase
LFQIKICGITSVKGARFASLAGADAIGLNFYDKSPRCIDLAAAEQVMPAIPNTVTKVGVFVNAEAGEITEIADRLDLDYLQLHGDEPPEFLGNFVQYKVIRAFRCGDDGFTPITAYLESCRGLGRLPDAVLLDAHHPDQYGGTGQAIDWGSVTQSREILGEIPLVLAGGLTPFNVTAAINTARPDAVDVASGVESAPGSKDVLLIRAFCTTAKKAFAQLSDEA